MSQEKPYAIAATFHTTPDIFHACEKVHAAGYKKWDSLTPFPVHGMQKAAGLKRSWIGLLTLCGGATGFTIGNLLAWYMGSVNYNLIVGGKAYYSPIFMFPVAYELTILLGAFGTLLGMFLFNRLPMHHHPIFEHPTIDRFGNDLFCLYIETEDPQFNEDEVRGLLAHLGGTDIVAVQNPA